MNPEKTHLYKKQYQQPIEEETPPKKGKSKTAATSDSRKRSKHKHIYKKIILHYGSDSFSWLIVQFLRIFPAGAMRVVSIL